MSLPQPHQTNKDTNVLISAHTNGTSSPTLTTAAVVASSTVASSNPNKYSKMNINNQFKGKSIEPQHKSTVVRTPHTGMQTLGKPVAARRMPPPAYLPSLSRQFNSSTPPSNQTDQPTPSNNNNINQPKQNEQNPPPQQDTPAAAPSTKTALVTGSSSMTNASQSSSAWGNSTDQSDSVSSQNTRVSLNTRTNSINQQDFPKLDEAIQIEKQQQVNNLNKQKPVSSNSGTSNEQSCPSPTETVSNGPVLKPSNVGNWGSTTTRVIPSEAVPDSAPSTVAALAPVNVQTQGYSGNRQYEPYNHQAQNNNHQRHVANNGQYQRPVGQYGNVRKYNNYSANSNAYQQYHSSNYHANNPDAGAYNVPSIIKEKEFNHIDDLMNTNSSIAALKRPNLFNKRDSCLLNGNEDEELGDHDKGNEKSKESWALISDQVDYNEKIEFLDDEEEIEKENKFEKSVILNDEEQIWESKRKEHDDDLQKSIERARLRRAEEERRISEQRQSVCAEKLRLLNSKKSENETQLSDVVVAVVASGEVRVNQVESYEDESDNLDQQNAKCYQQNRNLSQSQSQSQKPFNNVNNQINRGSNNNVSNRYNNQRFTRNDDTQHTSTNEPSYQTSQSQNRQNPRQTSYYNSNYPNTVTTAPSTSSSYQNRPNSKKQDQPQPQTNEKHNSTDHQSNTSNNNKKSIKQLTQNLPEIESNLQPLGTKKQVQIPTKPVDDQQPTESSKPHPASVWTSNKAQNRKDSLNSGSNSSMSCASTAQQTTKQHQDTKAQFRATSNPSSRKPAFTSRQARTDHEDDYYEEYTDEEDLDNKDSSKPSTNPVFIASKQTNNNYQNSRTYSNSMTRRGGPGGPGQSGGSQSTSNYKRPANSGNSQRRNFSEQQERRQPNYYNSNQRYYDHENTSYNNTFTNNSNNTNNSANQSYRTNKTADNRQTRDQTSVAKQSEHANTNTDYDEWETASDSSLVKQSRPSTNQPEPVASKTVPVKTNDNSQNSTSRHRNNRQFYNSNSNYYYQAQLDSHGYNSRQGNKNQINGSNKTVLNTADDPRYTAKYWSDSSKATTDQQQVEEKKQDVVEKPKEKEVKHQPGNLNYKKSFAQQRPVNQSRQNNQNNNRNVNLQVYRVENIIVDNPAAIKEALKTQNVESQAQMKQAVVTKNRLSGIDLTNRASVVIVDYVPEVSDSTEFEFNFDRESLDEENNDDGFQQVMTKRDKKAEKLKAAQAAAAAQKSENNKIREKNKNFKNDQNAKKIVQPQKHVVTAVPPVAKDLVKDKEEKDVSVSVSVSQITATEITTTTNTGANIMNNIQTWKNEIVQKNISKNLEKKEVSGPLSPSVDLNLKIESCKKVWDLSSAKQNGTELKLKLKQDQLNSEQKAKPELLENIKQDLSNIHHPTSTKEPSALNNKQASEQGASTKNVCTVKPTQQQVSSNLTVSTTALSTKVVAPASALTPPQPASALSPVVDQHQQPPAVSNTKETCLSNETSSKPSLTSSSSSSLSSLKAQSSSNITMTQAETCASNNINILEHAPMPQLQQIQLQQPLQQTLQQTQTAAYHYPATLNRISSPSPSIPASQFSMSSALMNSLGMQMYPQYISPHQIMQSYNMAQNPASRSINHQLMQQQQQHQQQQNKLANNLFDLSLNDIGVSQPQDAVAALNFYQQQQKSIGYLGQQIALSAPQPPQQPPPPPQQPPHLAPQISYQPNRANIGNQFDQSQYFTNQQQKSMQQNVTKPIGNHVGNHVGNTSQAQFSMANGYINNVISKPSGQFVVQNSNNNNNSQTSSNSPLINQYQTKQQQDFQYFNLNTNLNSTNATLTSNTPNHQQQQQTPGQIQTSQSQNAGANFFNTNFMSHIASLSTNPPMLPQPPQQQQQNQFQLTQNQLANNLLFNNGININNINQSQQQQQHRQTPLSSSISSSIIASPFINTAPGSSNPHLMQTQKSVEQTQDFFTPGFESSGYMQNSAHKSIAPSLAQSNNVYNRGGAPCYNTNNNTNNQAQLNKQMFPNGYEANLTNYDQKIQNIKPSSYYNRVEAPHQMLGHSHLQFMQQQPQTAPAPLLHPPLLPNPTSMHPTQIPPPPLLPTAASFIEQKNTQSTSYKVSNSNINNNNNNNQRYTSYQNNSSSSRNCNQNQNQNQSSSANSNGGYYQQQQQQQLNYQSSGRRFNNGYPNQSTLNGRKQVYNGPKRTGEIGNGETIKKSVVDDGTKQDLVQQSVKSDAVNEELNK